MKGTGGCCSSLSFAKVHFLVRHKHYSLIGTLKLNRFWQGTTYETLAHYIVALRWQGYSGRGRIVLVNRVDLFFFLFRAHFEKFSYLIATVCCSNDFIDPESFSIFLHFYLLHFIFPYYTILPLLLLLFFFCSFFFLFFSVLSFHSLVNLQWDDFWFRLAHTCTALNRTLAPK